MKGLIFMSKKQSFILPLVLFILFIGFTISVMYYDVKPIGPENSCVGYASLNQEFHELTGVHLELYRLTDLISIIPFMCIAVFAVHGLIQWIQRKNMFKVNPEILIMGALCFLVLAIYAFFQFVIVAYRPEIVEEGLEASYPSSTTVLCLFTFLSSIIGFHYLLESKVWKVTLYIILAGLCTFMVVARIISGVHWLTDLIGGMLLSLALVSFYYALCNNFIKE